MARLTEVRVAPLPLERFRALVGDEPLAQARRRGEAAAARLRGRVLWNVNSTARGGGVAEMLQSLLGYARDAGVDARWLVIEGAPEFFRVTKRLHHALHGSSGDGSPLGDAERAVYERVLQANADELDGVVRPRDVVLLHDPQTAGLAPHLARRGALVVWRCHIGGEPLDPEVERGWAFLRPYLDEVAAVVFSRPAYVPPWCNPAHTAIIRPSIDAFSPKNQELDEATVRAILVHTGLVEGPMGDDRPAFTRADGTPGRVDRYADIVRLGRAPAWETPLVVQVSRWDPLKDPVGVMRGFAGLVDSTRVGGAELVLAGPNVTAVVDDPEGAATLDEVIVAWRALPHAVRRRVHLACLPMADVEENAAIVNALQRHAAIVVQKSLSEGFGLTVTEAMWKGRPVVASAVGGILDQVDDGLHGLLLRDPSDPAQFAGALRYLLLDEELARRLGVQARERVRQEYLGVRHLADYATLLERIGA